MSVLRHITQRFTHCNFEIVFVHHLRIWYGLEDMLVQQGLFFAPFKYVQGCRPRYEDVTCSDNELLINLPTGSVVWLAWISQILNSNYLATVVFPIRWFEGNAIDKFSYAS